MAADDSVEYVIGNLSFHGRTTVRVRGDGAAEVEFAKYAGADSYRGYLSAEQLAELRAVVAANDPRALESGREFGVPDEARVKFTTSAGGLQTIVELWDNERRDLPAMKALIAAMTQISRGKVRY